jgi:hypothetical protein
MPNAPLGGRAMVRNPDGTIQPTQNASIAGTQDAAKNVVNAIPAQLGKLSDARQQITELQGLVNQSITAPAFLQTGWAAQDRTDFAKAANFVGSLVGSGDILSRTATANNEAFTKESTRAAFSLAQQTGGSRIGIGSEMLALRANPNPGNTPLGNVAMTNLLMQTNLRDTDRAQYVYQQAQRGVDPVQAGAAFDQANPGSRYVSEAMAETAQTMFPANVDVLRRYGNDPRVVRQFDARYGDGTAEMILSRTPPLAQTAQAAPQ